MNFYHLIILDASGSMDCIRRQALSGCNETITSIRSMQQQNPDQRHFISIVTFNSDAPAKTLCNMSPAETTNSLQLADYVPNACTPLYDAIGLSVNTLASNISSDGGNVLVTIITDGQENSSVTFDHRKIKSLINERKQQGWTFAFIGANINEVEEAEKIGIHNTLRFEQNEEQTGNMFRRLNKARERFCGSAAKSAAPASMETDFFSDL